MGPSNPEPNRALIPRGEARYGLVLVLLLANFVMLMTGSSSSWLRPLSVGLTGATLLAALYAANVGRRWRGIAGACVAIAFLGSLSFVTFGASSGEAAAGVLDAALIIVAPVVIARSVIRRRVIDVRTIMAALCIYVLLGMLWAFVFGAIGNIDSAAFFVQQSQPTSADYLYFSFITQLTVGYGDLTAAGNLGRACAVLEALIGQIYLVTVVAVLVTRLLPRDQPPPSTAASDGSA
jgi:Ion channel